MERFREGERGLRYSERERERERDTNIEPEILRDIKTKSEDLERQMSLVLVLIVFLSFEIFKS